MRTMINLARQGLAKWREAVCRLEGRGPIGSAASLAHGWPLPADPKRLSLPGRDRTNLAASALE